ncbi:reverse transcriptase SR3-right, partial [Elysia marginata]
ESVSSSYVILERLKVALDEKLREEQGGFRKGKSCADQIATLRIIVEQSLEWNSPLYVNFVHFEKAFDSVDRESLGKLLKNFGVPKKLTDLIRKMYDGITARVIHAGELTDPFNIKTGVRQGCLLSPFLLLLAIGYILRRSAEKEITRNSMDINQSSCGLRLPMILRCSPTTTNICRRKIPPRTQRKKSLGLKVDKNETKIPRIKTKQQKTSHIVG